MQAPNTHSPLPPCAPADVTVAAAPPRRAFTLTELLVVIVIISMLAAMAGYAVSRALESAKQTRIKTELDALDTAMKLFKEKYGAYPPSDMRDSQQLKQFIARAFPRCSVTQAVTDIAAAVDTQFRPDQALVFWLSGFNPDPANPFKNLGGATALPKSQRTPPLFDFDPTRLVSYNSTGGATPKTAPSYFPQGVRNKAPYVYFDPSQYGNQIDWDVNGSTYANVSDGGVANVYWNDINNNGTKDTGTEDWCNPETFQIIAPGLDGTFGTSTGNPRLYPGGAGYSKGDNDNVTNFCNKARLEDAKP